MKRILFAIAALVCVVTAAHAIPPDGNIPPGCTCDSAGNLVCTSFTGTGSGLTVSTSIDLSGGNTTLTTAQMPKTPGTLITNNNCDGNCTVLLDAITPNSTNRDRQAVFRYDDNDTGVFKICPPTGAIIEGCTASQCLKLDTTLGSYQGLRVCRYTDTLYQFCSWGLLGSHTCVSR